jgi:hypothetical protein
MFGHSSRRSQPLRRFCWTFSRSDRLNSEGLFTASRKSMGDVHNGSLGNTLALVSFFFRPPS